MTDKTRKSHPFVVSLAVSALAAYWHSVLRACRIWVRTDSFRNKMGEYFVSRPFDIEWRHQV